MQSRHRIISCECVNSFDEAQYSVAIQQYSIVLQSGVVRHKYGYFNCHGCHWPAISLHLYKRRALQGCWKDICKQRITTLRYHFSPEWPDSTPSSEIMNFSTCPLATWQLIRHGGMSEQQRMWLTTPFSLANLPRLLWSAPKRFGGVWVVANAISSNGDERLTFCPVVVHCRLSAHC